MPIVYGAEPWDSIRSKTILKPEASKGGTYSGSNQTAKLMNPERSDSLGALDFVDDFDSFNTSRWEKGAHTLGRGSIDRNNVSIGAGKLVLKLPAKKYNGAEVASRGGYKYGNYSAMMVCPKAPGSVTAFFLYQETQGGNDEIDIEIYNDETRIVDFTVWARGRMTNSASQTLDFDPTEAFHDYRISFHKRWVDFFVDGHFLQSWFSGLPVSSMKIVSNVWWPTWMSGPQPKTDSYARIDRVQYSGTSI